MTLENKLFEVEFLVAYFANNIYLSGLNFSGSGKYSGSLCIINGHMRIMVPLEMCIPLMVTSSVTNLSNLEHPAESSENTSKCDSYQKICFKVLTWKSMRKFFFS